jgi:HrpA-like RNA helicase
MRRSGFGKKSSVASEQRVDSAVRGAVPLAFKHHPDLPISARREDILDALRRHQVLIVAGDTGSGKSTQLPQYCLELGRGRDAVIAHTQPRRRAGRRSRAELAAGSRAPRARPARSAGARFGAGDRRPQRAAAVRKPVPRQQ